MLKIYKSVFFENYANFKGRSRRKEFWMFFLVNWAISFLLSLISPESDLFLTIYWIAIFIPSIAVAIRRMHDINKEWWYVLVPFYNVYLWTVIGDEGENKYGPDPISELEYLIELGKDLN
ncbi:DUF805 domain-containing protein [Flavobacterium sp. 3-218]